MERLVRFDEERWADRLNGIIHGLGALLFLIVLWLIAMGVGWLILDVIFPPAGDWLERYLRDHNDLPIFHTIVIAIAVMTGVWLRGWYNDRLNAWLQARRQRHPRRP